MATFDKTSTALHRPQGLLRRAFIWLRLAAERRRQRQALADLSDFQLRDIGLTRRDVAQEAAKPFWRL
jgi:uncharacterized protein YjiS (DUF1127 family)